MKICHITVLNPVDHTRILKYNKTFLKLGHEVTVIGKTPYPPTFINPKVQYYSTGKINRFFLHRIKTHVKIFFWWLQNFSQIDIFWIHTPELFWLFFLNRFFKKKQVYDVHENYFENTYHANYYAKIMRVPLAYLVRGLEKIISKIAFVVYAEYSYENILTAQNYKIITNTFECELIKELKIQYSEIPTFVISGNLSEEWGIMEAIDFWETQNQFEPTFLTIIGYASLPSFAKKIRERINQSPYKERCQLIGIEEYVPYNEIIKTIAQSNIVLAPYQKKKKFEKKIPTKFYEAIALNKTILFSDNAYWNTLNETYQFGICIQDWKSRWEYQNLQHHCPKEFYSWEAQKEKIEKIIQRMKK